MPRRNRVNNRERTVIVCGRDVISPVIATTASYALIPTNFQRLTALADSFDLYRFTDVRVTLMAAAISPNPSVGVMTACGYKNGVSATAPATVNEVINLDHSCVITHALTSAFLYQTGKSNYQIGRQHLISHAPLKWYKTQASAGSGTTYDLFDVQQGSLYFATNAATSSTPNVLLEWTCELCQPVNPADTPAPLNQTVTSRADTIRQMLATLGPQGSAVLKHLVDTWTK